MDKELLYKNLAKYYDLIYSTKKDYKEESKRLKKLISKYKQTDGKELLDVACGTGGHLKHLKKYFSCTGLDINQNMLKIAKEKNKKIKFIKSNMKNFKIEKKFDAILCLFSSIAYMRNYKNLKKALRNFSNHLKPGGVLILEPWIKKEHHKPNKISLDVYDGEKTKVVRMGTSKLKGDKTIINMHYLIGEKGQIKHFSEEHELGSFDRKKFLKYLQDAGMKVKFLKKGFSKDRGLLIGIKN